MGELTAVGMTLQVNWPGDEGCGQTSLGRRLWVNWPGEEVVGKLAWGGGCG